jgi:hypothetical protein
MFCQMVLHSISEREMRIRRLSVHLGAGSIPRRTPRHQDAAAGHDRAQEHDDHDRDPTRGDDRDEEDDEHDRDQEHDHDDRGQERANGAEGVGGASGRGAGDEPPSIKEGSGFAPSTLSGEANAEPTARASPAREPVSEPVSVVKGRQLAHPNPAADDTNSLFDNILPGLARNGASPLDQESPGSIPGGAIRQEAAGHAPAASWPVLAEWRNGSRVQGE